MDDREKSACLENTSYDKLRDTSLPEKNGFIQLTGQSTSKAWIETAARSLAPALFSLKDNDTLPIIERNLGASQRKKTD